MLTAFDKSGMKESVILLVFAGLLSEILIGPTIFFVFIGAILVWFKIRPHRYLRNLFALGIFVAYWVTYGKLIDPEIGLNFLTTIIILKLLEKETERDRYMIFFGLILLISAGSLFEKNLSYMFFFGLSFFALIIDFYKNLRLSTSILSLLRSLVWVIPFTAFLFFFTPRMMDPFQLEKGGPDQGEVGYTPEVNISQIENLVSNGRNVFQALVDKPLASDRLYWRGNTTSYSDGWNWSLGGEDRGPQRYDLDQKILPSGIKQSVRVFNRQAFFFGLDHPLSFITTKGQAVLESSHSLVQSHWRPTQRYEVVSSLQKISRDELNLKPYLRSALSKKEKAWIQDRFKSSSLSGLQSEIEFYFKEEGFSYSLSPGKVAHFLDFMVEKKIGFCAHYSSAVAHIMRVKGIPTRLVSGFLGGAYNRFSSFYLINQNDAHVWVEAFELGSWKRLDPTGWIAPDRVRLGGDAFINQSTAEGFSGLKFLRSRFNLVNDMAQWFGQWDFRFYQWLEEMDYYGQMAWLEKINFRPEWMFSIIPIILALFMGLYTWHLSRFRPQHNELELLWTLFHGKIKKRGLVIHFDSTQKGEDVLRQSSMKEKDQFVDIWQKLVSLSYKNDPEGNVKELKKRIQDL